MNSLALVALLVFRLLVSIMAFINFVILHSDMHSKQTPCQYSAAVPKMWNNLLHTKVLHCFSETEVIHSRK